MVRVEGGSFTMGSLDGDPDEQPPRTVAVETFFLDRTEVTVEAYEGCVQATSCPAPRTGGQCSWGHPAKRSHPVNCVDAAQAKAFCLWAGKRLPTEEEWEFAARGAEGRRFPWGVEAPAQQACWSSGLSCEAGGLPGDRTPQGVMDLAGNVSEWTTSAFCPYGQPCAAEKRSVRGGNFLSDRPGQLRGARRGAEDPRGHASHIGLRCAASLAP